MFCICLSHSWIHLEESVSVRNTECSIKFHTSELLQVTRTAGQNAQAVGQTAPATAYVVKREEETEVSMAPRVTRVSVDSI